LKVIVAAAGFSFELGAAILLAMFAFGKANILTLSLFFATKITKKAAGFLLLPVSQGIAKLKNNHFSPWPLCDK